jgi:hypothetical protein
VLEPGRSRSKLEQWHFAVVGTTGVPASGQLGPVLNPASFSMPNMSISIDQFVDPHISYGVSHTIFTWSQLGRGPAIWMKVSRGFHEAPRSVVDPTAKPSMKLSAAA